MWMAMKVTTNLRIAWAKFCTNRLHYGISIEWKRFVFLVCDFLCFFFDFSLIFFSLVFFLWFFFFGLFGFSWFYFFSFFSLIFPGFFPGFSFLVFSWFWFGIFSLVFGFFLFGFFLLVFPWFSLVFLSLVFWISLVLISGKKKVLSLFLPLDPRETSLFFLSVKYRYSGKVEDQLK